MPRCIFVNISSKTQCKNDSKPNFELCSRHLTYTENNVSKKHKSNDDGFTIVPNDLRANIDGPVTTIYMTGDIGDGIHRKFFLFGDIHVRESTYTNGMQIADFYRHLAKKSKTHIDVFIESAFDEKNNKDKRKWYSNYLEDIEYKFFPCLQKDKSHCKEPMRIHYADVRNLGKSKTSALTMLEFFRNVYGGISQRLDIIEWPDETEIWDVVHTTLREARLDDKHLLKLPPAIKLKFDKEILSDIKFQLFRFFSNFSNKELFMNCLEILKNGDISKKKYLVVMYKKLLDATSAIMDTYFLLRVFKSISEQEPSRKEFALKPGQYISKICAYFGALHVFHIRDILHKFGFELKFISGYDSFEQINSAREAKLFNQFVSTSELSSVIDDFIKD